MIEEGEYNPDSLHRENMSNGRYVCLLCKETLLRYGQWRKKVIHYDGGIWEANLCHECLRRMNND